MFLLLLNIIKIVSNSYTYINNSQLYTYFFFYANRLKIDNEGVSLNFSSFYFYIK